MMSKPVYVDMGLRTGTICTVNISHNGVVAINYSDLHNKGYLQLTNLSTKREVEFKVESGQQQPSMTIAL